MSTRFSFYLLLAIIVVTGIVLYRVMAGFLIPLFLAAVLVVMFRPIHRWISDRCRGRDRVAAALTTGAIMVIVIVPLAWIFTLALTEGIHLAAGASLESAREKVNEIREQYNLDLEDGTRLRKIKDLLDQLSASSDQAADQEGREKTIDNILDQLNLAVGGLATIPAYVEIDSPEQEFEASDQASVDKLTAAKNDLVTAVDGLREMNRANTEEFDVKIDETQLIFHSYKTLFLGGSFIAMLKDTLNPSDEQFRQLQSWIVAKLKGIMLSVTGTGAAIVSSLLFNLAIMIIAVYYFLADGPRMIHAGMRLSPLDDRYEAEMLKEFDISCRAVVLATLLTAVVQGCLAGFGYYFCGLNSVFLLTTLTMVLALVPFIGAAAIWIPASAWLLIDGQPTKAAILFAYGFLVVSMADNIVKPLVLHGQSNLHPLLALLSVIGGVQVLGPLGILVGPMLVTFLQALLNMLQSELDSLETSPES